MIVLEALVEVGLKFVVQAFLNLKLVVPPSYHRDSQIQVVSMSIRSHRIHGIEETSALFLLEASLALNSL